MPRPGTLRQAYADFAEVDAAGTLHRLVALALSRSDEALDALEALPAGARQPARVLAALHDLALAERAPALAAAYAAGDAETAARVAIETLVGMTGAVADVASRRAPLAPEADRCAVLLPAVAEVARRVGADTLGLVDVGCSAGFNLLVDRVGVAYGDGRSGGDPSSPVQLSCSVVGGRTVPVPAVPEVVARVGVDRDPVDVTDADSGRWLRACVGPDQPDRAARLDAALALATADPPLLLSGDVLDVLPDALAAVPADALPVVTTTWALSRLPPSSRLRFLQRLDAAATHRPVAWVSVEGVGVAPGIPTLGDRHASGHSIVGVAVLEASSLRAEAVGRCWSRGRMLAWLAGS